VHLLQCFSIISCATRQPCVRVYAPSEVHLHSLHTFHLVVASKYEAADFASSSEAEVRGLPRQVDTSTRFQDIMIFIFYFLFDIILILI
jgi:hypothetical protein